MSLHTCKEGSEFETANLMYRKVSLHSKANTVEPHNHAFSHDMIVTLGKVTVKLDDVEHVLDESDVLTVPAEALHSVTMCPCVESAEFLCVWPKLASYEETTRSG